ncbi:hypothetical protein FH972_021271 [Carpinus fangiana]|uniref:Arf-GAP domain-containing protein n=1 Tax=Carpinus fangiana TaxID=176857 RepID=A0A5N6KR12_9ROSI|nr:hypothetical protein FH972_021271 [Carpinus fangiana]
MKAFAKCQDNGLRTLSMASQGGALDWMSCFKVGRGKADVPQGALADSANQVQHHGGPWSPDIRVAGLRRRNFAFSRGGTGSMVAVDVGDEEARVDSRPGAVVVINAWGAVPEIDAWYHLLSASAAPSCHSRPAPFSTSPHGHPLSETTAAASPARPSRPPSQGALRWLPLPAHHHLRGAMGNVASRQEDGSLLYLRDQDRLHRDTDDDGIVEYVQDQDTQSVSGAPNFLLKLSNDEELFFYFTFAIRQAGSPNEGAESTSGSTGSAFDTTISNLTFVFAPTPKDLNALVTREFNADPNIHRNPNVDLVGDYTTGGKPVEQFEWSWKWRPPKKDEDKGGGWRNACSRAHRLNTLVTFSFWVHSTSISHQGNVFTADLLLDTAPMLASPRFLAPRIELSGPPRPRVPSSQSIESRLSDSDTDMSTKDMREPPSPTIQAIPENEPIPEPPLAATSTNTVKVDLMAQRSGEDMTLTDDGPVFRSTMKQLEGRTGSMKIRMKNVIERAKTARETQAACNVAVANFMKALREASASNSNAVQPALDHYFEKIAAEILQYEERNVDNLQTFIIDPLSKIYRNDIKQVDTRTETFEKESKDYYAYVSRYLGQRSSSLKEKHKVAEDDKYQSKRKTFELKRFDYSSFMQDLHGGRREQEVLSQLTRYADAQASEYLATGKKIEEMMPQLKVLRVEVNEVDKEYQLLRTGREEKRRALEKGDKVYGEPENTIANGSRPETEAGFHHNSVGSRYEGPRSPPLRSIPNDSLSTLPPVNNLSTSPASTREPRKSEYLTNEIAENPQTPQIKKEGLLWSLSRPGAHSSVDPRGLSKQQWHKFWIVLDQGKLSEYVNWKQNLEPHMEPIDLRMASVREARSAERRFCFEVITPNFTRVYQATGEDDMRSWIVAINNALQSAFESRNPHEPVQSSASSRGNNIARDLFGKSSSYHGHRSSSSAAYYGQKHVHRHATVGDRPPLTQAQSNEERPARLLQTIRAADAGNSWCADCGSDIRVEWVSINLGIIVCIECSGIHRSLGTHVSKIRSLTLDTTSFTQDIVELLLTIGNRVSNMVWEAKLDQATKPNASSPRDQRLKFITAKYVDKAYVEPIASASSSPPAPDDTLLMSIKRNDIQHVLHALALAASPNVTDRSRATHSVFLALAAADPAAPGSGSGSPSASTINIPGTSGQPATTQERKSFPIAELLAQNGANIPDKTSSPIPLSKDAILYLDFKTAQKMGRLAVAGADVNVVPGNPPEQEKRSREKLLKRSSAGGFYTSSRLAKNSTGAP